MLGPAEWEMVTTGMSNASGGYMNSKGICGRADGV